MAKKTKVTNWEIMEYVCKYFRSVEPEQFVESVNKLLGTTYKVDDIEFTYITFCK